MAIREAPSKKKARTRSLPVAVPTATVNRMDAVSDFAVANVDGCRDYEYDGRDESCFRANFEEFRHDESASEKSLRLLKKWSLLLVENVIAAMVTLNLSHNVSGNLLTVWTTPRAIAARKLLPMMSHLPL